MPVPIIPGMSCAQAARELGVTPTYVRLLMSEGRLKYVQTALGRLIDEKSVAALKVEREQRKAQAHEEVTSG